MHTHTHITRRRWEMRRGQKKLFHSQWLPFAVLPKYRWWSHGCERVQKWSLFFKHTLHYTYAMPASEGGRVKGAAEVPFSGAEQVPTHLQHTTDEAGKKNSQASMINMSQCCTSTDVDHRLAWECNIMFFTRHTPTKQHFASGVIDYVNRPTLKLVHRMNGAGPSK